MLTFEAVRAPYPGLRPFEADEADLFFGRERHVDALLKRLSGSHFVAVVGESGAGKSSLVRAGLLPALQAGFVVEAGSDWRVAVMRPGGAPLDSLAGALLQPGVLTDAGGSPREEFALAELRRGPLGLVQLVRDAHHGSYCNLLVVVDQFEEVFRYCREPAQKDQADIFVELILRAADQRNVPIFVVLTMRSDFVGDCARFRGLPETLNDNQYLTPRLTREQIAAAIREPARVCGGMVDPALVAELCNAVGDNPDQLPLLQHLMMRVWDRASEHAMPPRLTGDIAVKLGGLYSALNHHAQNVYDALRDDQKPIARAMFKRLTDPLSQRRDLRRDAVVSDIAAVASVDPAAVIAVADAFRATGRHMLMPPPAIPLDAGSRLDISHESLIRQWVTLDAWAREENVSAREFLRLRDEAQGELQGQADPLTGRDLTRALDWMRQAEPTPAWAARYCEAGELETTVAFINRSAAEAQKRKDDAAQLVAREAKAKRQRVVSRLSVAGLVLASSLAVVILSLYSDAKTQGEKAESLRLEAEEARNQAVKAKESAVSAAEEAKKNENRADAQRLHAIRETERAAEAHSQAHARQLAASSRVEVQTDPDLAVLLAGAAVHERETDPQALDALRTALAAHVSSFESVFRVAKSRHYIPGSDKTKWLEFALSDASISSREPLAVVPSGGEAIVFSLESGRQQQPPLRGHKGIVGAARFSPDGKLIATSSQDHTAALWDVSTHERIAILGQNGEHKDMLNDVIFSPDGKLLLTLGDDHRANVWPVGRDAKCLCPPLTADVGNFVTASFSQDRRHLVTVIHVSSRRLKAQMWSIAGDACPKLDQTFDATTQLKWASFSPHGPWLGIVQNDGEVAILRATEGWPRAKTIPSVRLDTPGDDPLKPHDDARLNYPPPLAWSADGQYVASAGLDHVIRVMALDESSSLVQLRGHGGRVTSLAFHPSASVLLSTSVDGSARLWKLDAGAQPAEVLVLKGHKDSVGSGVFASRGTSIVTAGDDGKVRVWQPQWKLIEKHLPGAQSLAFTADARRVWVAGTNEKPAENIEEAWAAEFDRGTLNQVKGPSVRPGRSLELVGSHLLDRLASGELTVRNLRLTKASTMLAGSRRESIDDRLESPDGRWLLARPDLPRVWDLASPARAPDRLVVQSDCVARAISNDRHVAWYCSEDDRVMITRIGQRGFVSIQIPDRAIATAMQFSTNGRSVAVNFEDHSVRVFESTTLKTTLILRGHDDDMERLAFSADDRLLLGVGKTRSRIWELPGGDRIAMLPVAIRADSIEAAVFSPDARSLAFLKSGRLLIWDCPECAGKDELLAELKRHRVTRAPTDDEKARFDLKAHDSADNHAATARPEPVLASTTGAKPR